MQELLGDLGLVSDPIPIDDAGLLFLAPACNDWGPVVTRHQLTAVLDLESGLDAGIPARPDRIIYIYFPFADEDLPELKRLHAVARLGAELVQGGERVLVHCQMGLNRSALVAGLILVHTGMAGAAAVARLQERRPGALFNERFCEYLGQQPPGGLPIASA
jgi:protein-tyrosine phosphatase